jgi:hypothetical protein
MLDGLETTLNASILRCYTVTILRVGKRSHGNAGGQREDLEARDVNYKLPRNVARPEALDANSDFLGFDDPDFISKSATIINMTTPFEA